MTNLSEVSKLFLKIVAFTKNCKTCVADYDVSLIDVSLI